MDDKDKCLALIFDEMSLESSLVYNHGLDKIAGFEDFGELETSEFVANHALVFMVRGLLSKWKQPQYLYILHYSTHIITPYIVQWYCPPYGQDITALA